MKNKLIFTVLAAGLMVAAGCATTKSQKEIDRQVAQETNINTTEDLAQESDQLIENAQGLTDKQRMDLISLREVTRIKNEQLNKESLRLKSLMMKDLMSDNYSTKQVQLLKSKIKKTESKKLSNYFDAVSQASRILGKDQQDNDYIMRDFEYRYR